MSEIYDALLRAQRDVQSKPTATGEEHSNGRATEPSNGVAQAPAQTKRERSRRLTWPRWLRRNGTAAPGAAGSELLIDASGGGDMAEAFRMLRGFLLGLDGGMIMTTSAMGEEGKTLCSANLGISLSLPSRRDVLLVDLDLRRPALSARLGVPSSPGVVECLSGSAKWQDCLRPTAYPRLFVLPAGNRLKSAPELLASEAMRQLLGELRRYAADHFILFDTPPVLLTADALTLAREMDRIVLVVRAGATSRIAVQKAIAAVGNEKLLGVVFNQANTQASDYYHYGGTYGYYGGYGSGPHRPTGK